VAGVFEVHPDLVEDSGGVVKVVVDGLTLDFKRMYCLDLVAEGECHELCIQVCLKLIDVLLLSQLSFVFLVIFQQFFFEYLLVHFVKLRIYKGKALILIAHKK